MRTIVIIPTYNERENIEWLASQVVGLGPDLDLLFVDDNSPDGTGELIDRLAKADSRIAVLHREEKLGLGSAYILKAHGPDHRLSLLPPGGPGGD